MRISFILLSLTISFFSSQFVLAEESSSEIQATYDQLNLLNQDLRCQESSDCLAIPTGHRACGGPSGFAIASRLNLKLAQLRELARRTSVLEREYNFENGIISICSIEAPPEVQCIQNKCQ